MLGPIHTSAPQVNKEGSDAKLLSNQMHNPLLLKGLLLSYAYLTKQNSCYAFTFTVSRGVSMLDALWGPASDRPRHRPL